MIVLDRTILDEAEALDVSFDLAMKNINTGYEQTETLREQYKSDHAMLRRLSSRALSIEYSRESNANTLAEMRGLVAAMVTANADYEIVDRKIARGWEQVSKVMGAHPEDCPNCRITM